ncbi:MAG: GNAT family N-acetyltransferase [Chloroflexi bacterium]|nr:GNAT family N-acetyltransferase [Chloroflexota bacterium]
MIEPPQPDDVPEIERIALATGAFNPNEVAIVREMLDCYFHPEPRDDHTFVVYRNGTQAVVGFACYGPTPLTDRIWDLYWICVDRAYQKNGIGRVLLRQVEQSVCERGARAIYLETSDSAVYMPAREFYERNGYQFLAHIDNFYAPGEGKVIYRKVFRRE